MRGSNGAEDSSNTVEVYHEKQTMWRCGLHAVNALLQRKAYTAREFDTLADNLIISRRFWWIHPHRSLFGLGNYDVNVLMCAIESAGYDVQWLPENTNFRDLVQKHDALVGFLVNVSGNWQPPWPLNFLIPERRHWLAVSRYPEQFYIVDSNLRSPSRLDDEDALTRYFVRVKSESAHVLSVEKKRIS